MKKIKIAQLGVGHMHAYKIKTLRQLNDIFEVVGVADDDPKQREAFGKHEMYQGLKWMSEEELLRIPGLEAVAVEKEEHDLIPAALRCIRAGMHLHLDKPGGESLEEFDRLLDEAKKRNRTVQMGYMYRNSPAIQFCIKAVKEGLLGNIFEVDTVMSRYDGDDFRQLLKGFKGGAPYIFACHLIDLAVILLGKPEHIYPLSRCTRSDGLLDNGFTVFEYPQGCTVTIRATVTEVEGFQRRHLTVCGDKGTIVIQPLELEGNKAGGVLRLALSEDRDGWKKGCQTVPMPPLKDRYEDQLREFAAIVRGELTNPYPYAHEHLVQQCLLEACGIEK
jgi:predicted dehydrogenase